MGEPSILTKTEFARLRGWSPPYVSKLIRLKKLRPPAIRPDGKIDRVQAEAMLALSRDPAAALDDDDAPLFTAGAEDDDDADESFTDVRIVTEKLKQDALRIQLAREAGKLVDKGEVERATFSAARAARDAILTVPAQVAGELAAMNDETQIRAFLSQALREALTRAATDVDPDAGESE